MIAELSADLKVYEPVKVYEPTKLWYFTFVLDSLQAFQYVVVRGTWISARDKVIEKFGMSILMQYNEEKFKELNLHKSFSELKIRR